MSSSKKNINYYKDLDLDFSANSITEDLKVRDGKSSIAQSIRNLLLTYPGERPFSSVGAGILEFLFELNTPQIGYLLKERVFNTIKLHEPRIVVEFNNIEIEILNNNSLRINIKYKFANNLEMGSLENLSLLISGE